MLSGLRKYIVRTRLIPYSFWADKMAIESLKMPLLQYQDSFYFLQARKYFECRFYSQISSSYRNLQFQNKYQQELYEQSLSKLKQFKQVDQLVQAISLFAWDVNVLFQKMNRNITSNNFSSHKQESDITIENDIKQIIDMYNNFLRELQAYPEWYKKVTQEIGHSIHLIYNHFEAQNKEDIFKDFNKHSYFV